MAPIARFSAPSGCEYGSYERTEFRNARLDHIPHDLVIDAKVFMYEAITHSGDLPPVSRSPKDILRFREYPRAHEGRQCLSGDEFYASPESPLDEIGESHEPVEVPGSRRELDQYVDITVRGSLSAEHGSEKRESHDAHGVYLGSTRG
jgi:hypothetical protein